MPLRIFKTKTFRRFQRREGLDDADLAEAMDRAEAGLIDADLGRGLIKQRIARRGQGKSGGYRTIIAYRQGRRAVFIFGFAKNESDNISHTLEAAAATAGAMFLDASKKEIEALIRAGELWEVGYDDENQV